MKIYEYARKRNISSRDIVKKLHELGFTHIKNHLSLVPLKVIEKLDEIDFTQKKTSKTIVFISFECAPFSKSKISEYVSNKIKMSKDNKNIIILPRNNIDIELELMFESEILIDELKINGKVYKTKYKNDDYYLIEKDIYLDNESYKLSFYNQMALKIIQFINCEIDIINIHDWKFGLFPLMFKEIKHIFPQTIIEFSLYGATYRGIYSLDVLTDVFNIDRKFIDLAEYAGSINLLKAGIVSADKIDVTKEVLDELKASYLKEFVYDNM